MDQDKSIICHATRRNFRYILVWPSFEDELNPKKNYYVKVVLYFLLTSLFMFSMLVHLLITITQDLDRSVSEDIAGIASMVGMLYMMFIYVKHELDLALLYRDLSNFSRFEKPPNFEQLERTLNFFSNVAMWYTISGVTVYALIKWFLREKCEMENTEKDLNEDCGFVVQTWIPFNTKPNLVVYYISYVIVFLGCQLIMKSNLMVTFNAFEIAQHVILRIVCLTKMLKECFNDQDYESARKKLTICITYHIDILNLAKRLDECFSAGMLTHITITAIICACLEKQFAEGDRLLAAMHVSGWILTLIFACVSGQLLINSSESIPEAIWFSKWYEADIRLRKDVIFMLLRSQENLYLTAGPFNVLSFSLLVSVIKTSYSIFCFLTS